MHEVLELIIPNTNFIDETVNEVLKEYQEEENERNGFYDWYQIGGRFSGNKLLLKLGKEKIESFNQELVKMKITVSGLRFGKQELSPANQIEIVDKLWNEWFPDSELKKCPLFKHSNNSDEYFDSDICLFENIPDGLTASTFIVAAYRDYNKKTQAVFMLHDEIWNGVVHQKTRWNGSIKNAIKLFNKHLKYYSYEYREDCKIKSDHLVITIDYHT